MPAPLEEAKSPVEEQAIHALNHLSDKDKEKVLKYIASLLTLEQINHDEASAT
jgi:hypothetical protein